MAGGWGGGGRGKRVGGYCTVVKTERIGLQQHSSNFKIMEQIKQIVNCGNDTWHETILGK